MPHATRPCRQLLFLVVVIVIVSVEGLHRINVVLQHVEA